MKNLITIIILKEFFKKWLFDLLYTDSYAVLYVQNAMYPLANDEDPHISMMF